MDFVNKLKDSISTASQEVTNKAKATTETVKINNMIKSNEKMVEKLIYQVGVQCFGKYGQDQETEYMELFSEINRLKTENAELQRKVEELAAGNTCPYCGRTNMADAKFCLNCGTPLSKTKQESVELSEENVICPKCNTVNEKDASFCCGCGTSLKKEVQYNDEI